MKNLRKLRLKHGLTQIQLSKLTGFSRSKIQRHERFGGASPQDKNWYKKVLL